MIKFLKAVPSDISFIAKLALQLWPDNTIDGLKNKFDKVISNDQSVVYLATKNNECIAFGQCSIRNDYVEGTENSPVGYLEGIFVVPEYRKQGVAKQLLQICETWSKERGCHQFASDCELSNTESLCFHLSSGFKEINRIICFLKDID